MSPATGAASPGTQPHDSPHRDVGQCNSWVQTQRKIPAWNL